MSDDGTRFDDGDSTESRNHPPFASIAMLVEYVLLWPDAPVTLAAAWDVGRWIEANRPEMWSNEMRSRLSRLSVKGELPAGWDNIARILSDEQVVRMTDVNTRRCATRNSEKGRRCMTPRTAQLFDVKSVTDLHGYKKVTISWVVEKRERRMFGPDGSLGIPYREVISGYDQTDRYRQYTEMALEEFFTADEAARFAEWLAANYDDRPTITPARFPLKPNLAGYLAMDAGGGIDFYEISGRSFESGTSAATCLHQSVGLRQQG